MSDYQDSILHDKIRQLTAIGASLSAEKDTTRLLESILSAAREMTLADAGTLYLIEKNQLKFEILHNETLNIRMGGKSGLPMTLGPIPLYRDGGALNDSLVVTSSVLHNQTINIPDVYDVDLESEFDFSGTRAFDLKTGYRSRSFLTIPLKNHENEVIGALQLINATDALNGSVTHFSPDAQQLAESLASQAAIALTTRQLIEQMRGLFEALIEGINIAIDEKSPYTGGHGQRVPILAQMLAEAANRVQEGEFASFHMSEEELYELKIAALLHDCGKLATPVHVVDKATKLETIFDRIHLVEARFETLRRDAEIAMLKDRIHLMEQGANEEEIATLQQRFQQRARQLDEDFDFLQQCNFGREFMSPQHQERVRRIAVYPLENRCGERVNLLSGEEAACLEIPRGTLTPAERDIINRHALTTLDMLERLPWPRHLSKVPAIAGAHHERLDGKGYPKGLLGEEMSPQMRILAIADVFEALTAKDRPYRPGMSLMHALTILGKMSLDKHIDPELFRLFIREKVYLRYAGQFLDPGQFGGVDEAAIPGYLP